MRPVRRLKKMELALLPDSLAICRLAPDAPIPQWALAGEFFAVCRSDEELSVVCSDGHPPTEIEADSGWRALKVQGPLPLTEIGVIAALSAPLAKAGIPVFVISTFNTDYLLIKEANLSGAVRVLSSDHTVHTW
jgi:hypothetical protein